MEAPKIKLIIIWVFILLGGNILGQNIETNSKLNKNTNSYFSLYLNYSNDYVFMGRKDSITAPYLYFIAEYQHKSGFYANGSVSYLTKDEESRVDLFLFDLGYNFTVDNFFGDFSVTKYFFNENSYNVLSEVDINVSALANIDFKIVNLMLTASTYLGESSSDADFFLFSEISHDFVTNNKKFQFSPTAGIYFGSQNFYEAYYVNNRYGNGGRPKLKGKNGSGNSNNNGDKIESGFETIDTEGAQVTSELVIKESENFNLMAAEFSLPMWYIHNSLTISLKPSLVFPFNKATIFVDDIIVKEDIKETFYWMLGCSYKFN
ncbi:hypothetical protein [uncultured Lutibacter sp.]|uniref:hypothetical protein n=1 Tax=uncultured Lutibacter sp. TaxID=437739 RepID=UPI0026093A30|nr:hypothetical protein [uncultured Lutibacter sp.]